MIHANYYEQRLGPEFIKQMALWVKDGDPNAKLFVNDYDILTGNRLDDYVKHIRDLLAIGVPIAGIGVQGHLHGDTFDPAALQHALDELAKFNLPDSRHRVQLPRPALEILHAGDRTRRSCLRKRSRPRPSALRQYFRICFAHPSVTGIMMWGFWEGANWIPQSSLYKRDWTPTPAAEAYRDLVLKQWWTRWSGQASADGYVVLRAFYGKHRVTVNGKEIVVTLPKAERIKLVELN